MQEIAFAQVLDKEKSQMWGFLVWLDKFLSDKPRMSRSIIYDNFHGALRDGTT